MRRLLAAVVLVGCGTDLVVDQVEPAVDAGVEGGVTDAGTDAAAPVNANDAAAGRR